MKNPLLKLSLIFSFIVASFAAEARTKQIYTVYESDGSITFYALTTTPGKFTEADLPLGGISLTYHDGNNINTSTYDFTEFVTSIPASADLIADCNAIGDYYQVVNVKLCGVSASVTTTEINNIDKPSCYRQGGVVGHVTFDGLTVTAATTASHVYSGYSPLSCADLSAFATGGSGSYSWSWSSGDNTNSATVCPTTSTSYTVTATDASGCVGTASLEIDVLDVRCGKKMDKVQMCKSPGKSDKKVEICVAASAVPAQLKGGATLGSCPLGKVAFEDNMISMDMDFKAYPNPFNNFISLTFTAVQDEHVRVEAFDITGRRVGVLFNENVEEGVYYAGNTQDLDYPHGIIILHVVHGEIVRYIKLHHKQE